MQRAVAHGDVRRGRPMATGRCARVGRGPHRYASIRPVSYPRLAPMRDFGNSGIERWEQSYEETIAIDFVVGHILSATSSEQIHSRRGPNSRTASGRRSHRSLHRDRSSKPSPFEPSSPARSAAEGVGDTPECASVRAVSLAASSARSHGPVSCCQRGSERSAAKSSPFAASCRTRGGPSASARARCSKAASVFPVSASKEAAL